MMEPPEKRTKSRNFKGFPMDFGLASEYLCQLLVDRAVNLVYENRNRTPHASASVCAPGGSFFARSTGKAGFQ